MANISPDSIPNSKLLQIDKGILHAGDAFIVLIKTEWNAAITDELERGCNETFRKQGITRLLTITVPGAFEIPFTIKNFWEKASEKPDAFIAFGCIVKGDTPHFDYVCKAVTDGVLQLNMSLPVPSIFGVLTVDNEAQARERAGGKHGHKGEEAAITAMKMIALNRSFKK